MNFVDIGIIFIIILGAIVGFKQGAIKRLTTFLGTFIIVVVAFKYKSYLSVILYESLPFFDFDGLIRGAQVINILVYELVAFFLLFLGLTFILRVLITISGLFETLLKMTIFLSIPSKILGIFVGAIEYFVYVFLFLVFFSIPAFTFTRSYIEKSSIALGIVNNTPILSNMASSTIDTYSMVYDIIHDKEIEDESVINTEIVKVLLDSKIVNVDSIDKLVDKNKIYINDKSFLDEYREEDKND